MQIGGDAGPVQVHVDGERGCRRAIRKPRLLATDLREIEPAAAQRVGDRRAQAAGGRKAFSAAHDFVIGEIASLVRRKAYRDARGCMQSVRYLVLMLASLLAAEATALGQQPPPAGRIKVAAGSAFIVRQGQSIPAQVGQLVFEADGLRTAADGRVGVTLNDDTRVSLGPSSEIRLDRFLYAPAEGRLGFALRVVSGIVAYVSGRIAKLSPDSIRLETPSAVVGVRGTRLAIRVTP